MSCCGVLALVMTMFLGSFGFMLQADNVNAEAPITAAAKLTPAIRFL
jgi:hypothetical protein